MSRKLEEQMEETLNSEIEHSEEAISQGYEVRK